MKSNFCIFIAVFFVWGCNTAPKRKEPPPKGSAAITEPRKESETISIDYLALQRALQMERDRENLGLTERLFNTCDAGFGYSSSKDCHQEHLVVLHFRLLCRESEGTISTILTDSDLRPLERRSIEWNLKGVQGVVQTDSDGYAKIVTAARISQKSQRIRLRLGREFLYMRTSEIGKVITPQPWCDQY